MTRLLLPLAMLALAAAGCGSSSKTTSSSTSTPAPASGSSSTSSPQGTVTIHMQNIQFNPKSQTVKVGQKVTWVNDDSVDHNVTAKSGASFQSSTFGQGQSFSFTPTKPGTVSYVCTIHPGMTGTLTVTR